MCKQKGARDDVSAAPRGCEAISTLCGALVRASGNPSTLSTGHRHAGGLRHVLNSLLSIP